MSRLPNVHLSTYVGALCRACISELTVVGSALYSPQEANLVFGSNLLTLLANIEIQDFGVSYFVNHPYLKNKIKTGKNTFVI